MTEREKNELAKTWLRRYKDAKRELDRLEAELHELTARQEGADAIRYTDMPRAPGVDGDLSDLFVQREAIRREIVKAMTHATMIMEGVKSVIDEIPDSNIKYVLSARYIRLKRWEDICRELGYSWTPVHEYHRKGLRQIYRRVFESKNRKV